MMTQTASPSPHDEVEDRLVVRFTQTEGAHLVRPVGEIDIATCAILDERLRTVDGAVVVDLTWVTFIADDPKTRHEQTNHRAKPIA